MNIIGITGRAGSGKSTVANMIVEMQPRARIIMLAEPIKEFCRQIFDFSEEQLYGPSSMRNAPDERYDVSPRKILQTLGTDWARSVYEDVWVDYAMRRAEELLEGSCVKAVKNQDHAVFKPEFCDLVVIPDVRFPNEAEAIRARDGKIIRVVRKGFELESAHASESCIDDIAPDAVIDNGNKPLAALRELLTECLRQLPHMEEPMHFTWEADEIKKPRRTTTARKPHAATSSKPKRRAAKGRV